MSEQASEEPSTKPRNRILHWWGHLSVPQREGYGLGALCLGSLTVWLSTVTTIHPEWRSLQTVFMVGGYVFFSVSAFLSAMLMANTKIQKTISFSVVSLAALALGYATYLAAFTTSAEIVSRNSFVGAPIVPMRAQFKMFRGTRPDEKGRIVFGLTVVNQSSAPIKARVYSSVQIQPFVSMAADSSFTDNKILEAKNEVRSRFKRHNTESVQIEPGSVQPGGQNMQYFAVGPVLTNDQWRQIEAGAKYVYVFSLIAVNDDPKDPASLAICGIGNGNIVNACSAEWEKW